MPRTKEITLAIVNDSPKLQNLMKNEGIDLQKFAGLSTNDIFGIISGYEGVYNLFLSEMFDKIIKQRVFDPLEGDLNPFSIFQRESGVVGSGAELLAVDVVDSDDYDPDSTPNETNRVEPKVAYQRLRDMKKWFVTVNQSVFKGAFTSEGTMEVFINNIVSKLRQSRDLYLRDVIMDDIISAIDGMQTPDVVTNPKGWVIPSVILSGGGNELFDPIPSQFYTFTPASPTEESSLYTPNYTNNDGNIVGATYLYTESGIKALYRNLIQLAMDMSIPNTTFTPAGNTSTLPLGKGILILSTNAKSLIDVHIMASLLNSGVIDGTKYFDKVILSEKFEFSDLADGTFIGIILHPDSYLYDFELDRMTSRFNESNLDTTYWLHTWVSRAVNPLVPACALKINAN